MEVVIDITTADHLGRAFVTWRPVEARLRLVNVPQGSAAVPVTVSCSTRANGGKLLFATTLTDQGQATLDLALPEDGSDVTIFVGGEFQSPSSAFGDVSIEVRESASNVLLGNRPVMVRIRKNANALTSAERDRFLVALAALNAAGTGPYANFRDMHVAGAPSKEAHGGPGFLPWHRTYLLDFERLLQAIDAEVTLPYWRFDQAAPNIFNRNFMGVANGLGQVQFSAGHPLLSWVAWGSAGIVRGAGVGPSTVPSLKSEAQTLTLGGVHGGFGPFSGMESNPHGPAHMSHLSGWITVIGTAPRDPIFFLLHCNVDRLWSKWQWVRGIYDPSNAIAFTPNAGYPLGHRLHDQMWPWCGPLPAPRPTTAPGGPLAASPMTIAPGPSPRIHDMIDYLGTVPGAAHLDFAYDDVPFQMLPPAGDP